MKKRDSRRKFKRWIKRFLLALLVVFVYWVNEKFQILSIHRPSCLLIILSFFVIISLADILFSKILGLEC